ncbi:coniferyl aldehyde dehydrogenase [Lactiplantibacillus plantarum]|nr:coniferyl aldehyde dehydrogenase [Lactiplantibacillus plantarum]
MTTINEMHQIFNLQKTQYDRCDDEVLYSKDTRPLKW